MVQRLYCAREEKMSTATEYRTLLLKYPPQPIRSGQDYQRAVAQLEKLMVPQPGEARGHLIEVLSTLIENYESREHPTPLVSPTRMLAHLLEARGVKRRCGQDDWHWSGDLQQCDGRPTRHKQSQRSEAGQLFRRVASCLLGLEGRFATE
jgi:hypothetical protein